MDPGIINYTQQNMILSHKIYLFAVWSALVELPRLLIRYGKVTVNNYLNLHSISMTILSLGTLYYIAAMLILVNVPQQELDASPALKGHFICAIMMIVIVVLQMGTGIAIRSMVFAKRYTSWLPVIKIVHSVSGYLTILLGRVTITLGLITQGIDQLSKPWYYIFGAIYLLLILIEVMYRLQVRVFLRGIVNNKLTSRLPEDHFYFEIPQLIEEGVPHSKILTKYPDAKYVIIDNGVYCIDDLDHPGGEFIINEVQGRQINYLLYGCHSAMCCPIRHKHSKYIWKYLSSRMVGRIRVDKLIDCSDQDGRPQWIVEEVDEYSNNLSVFKFSSKTARFMNSFLSIKNLGKFFIIQSFGEGIAPVRRPYTMVVCMTDDNIKLRTTIKQIYKNREAEPYVDMVQCNQYSRTLPLAIKLYPDGQFTSYLSNFSHKGFKILGPYGLGLQMTDDSRGRYVILAAGTGILPFLDLLDFLLKKIIFKVLEHKAGTAAADNINPLRYNYQLLDELKITLYATFTNKEEFYGSSIITDLFFLNQIHGLDYFDLNLRFSNGDKEDGIKSFRHGFDEVFLKTIVDSQPDRIYVCGPDAMTKSIRDHMDQMMQDYQGQVIYL